MSSVSLDVFHTPNSATFVCALKECAALAIGKKLDKKSCLRKGVSIHMQAREHGFDRDLYVASTLVDMYSKCGDILRARNVFDGMRHRSVVSWNVLILGYVENGESSVALDVFNSMDCAPNRVTFVAALKACASLATNLDKKTCVRKGVSIHRQATEQGFDRDILVANTLVDMYSKCGDMLRARAVFNRMTQRDVVSWTVLTLGYVGIGECSIALDVFNAIECARNRLTFVAALKACAGLAGGSELEKEACLRKGLDIHKQARERGFDRDVFVASTLIDMYSKCGDVLQARHVFDGMTHRSVVSWNALMLGYVENEDHLLALEVFNNMDCAANQLSFAAVLKACAGLAAGYKMDKWSCLQKGVAIHGQAREHGCDKDSFVENTLVDMYSKCGDMIQARGVFDGMMHRDVISWNALIHGYVENREGSAALEAFSTMDCAPNAVTFVAALKACSSIGALEIGERIHERLHELELEKDEMVASCLVDFYGKCGNMPAAEEVFKRMRSRNVVSWNALIGGYSLLGDTSQVFRLVERVQESGLQIDGVTMLLILTACSHAGLVEEGQMYFESTAKYGVSLTCKHYRCMVDMLGRANMLQEALSLAENMPFESSGLVWMTLLAACRKWSNVEIGKVAFMALLTDKNKEHVAAAYVLMRNTYEKLGMQLEGEQIEAERRKVRRTWWYDAQGRITRSFTLGDNIEEEVAQLLKFLFVPVNGC